MKKKSQEENKKNALIISGNLREIRVCHGLSQRRMGQVLGVTSQQIQKYETGENRLPIEKLYLLKNFLNISYDDVFVGLIYETASIKKSEETFPNLHVLKKLGRVKDKKTQTQILKILDVLCEA